LGLAFKKSFTPSSLTKRMPHFSLQGEKREHEGSRLRLPSSNPQLDLIYVTGELVFQKYARR